MFDNLNERDGLGGEARDRARRSPEKAKSIPADREVPLSPTFGSTHIAPAVHAWLDGDLPEAAARAANPRDVELWNRINAGAAQLRHMRTPVHVQERIMAALPQTTPRVITPWWRRPVEVTPLAAFAAAAGLVAFGDLLASTVARPN
jgi:hypothetical protein